VNDARGHEVLAVKDAITPWSQQSEPCLHCGDAIVGALKRGRFSMNTRLGRDIVGADGSTLVQVRRSSIKSKGVIGFGTLYKIDPCNPGPLEEPFASAALVAVLIKTQEPKGGGA
jgi:hypothetical protein